MTKDKNQNPEQIARDKIDLMLIEAGWIVQSKNEVDLGAGRGIALREYQAETKFADYVLFVDKNPVGIIEAKKEDEGHKLTVAEDQASEYVWAAYAQLENVKSKQLVDELTALVSLIRRACGIDKELKPFDSTIDENFKNWIFKQNAGTHNRFSPEQMDWLRELKNHVVNSYHIEIEDLDYTPFDEKGGRGKMYQFFGAEMNDIINELNEVLAA